MSFQVACGGKTMYFARFSMILRGIPSFHAPPAERKLWPGEVNFLVNFLRVNFLEAKTGSSLSPSFGPFPEVSFLVNFLRVNSPRGKFTRRKFSFSGDSSAAKYSPPK